MKASFRSLLLSSFLFVSITRAGDAWTNIDGQKMDAEFLGRKGDYVAFKKTADGSRYLYPYAKLTLKDQARVDALINGTASSAATEDEADAPSLAKSRPTPAPGPAADANITKFARQLAGKLVAVQGKQFTPVPASRMQGTRLYAIYYSAHWCPPCRTFTPELVKSYKEITAKHPEFELVFVSSDQDEKSMLEYMTSTGMIWTALRYSETRDGRLLGRPDYENGIPNLVLVDADGKDIFTSYTKNGDYEGPQKVLQDIRKRLRM